VLTGLRIDNNLYTQIGIILLIALSQERHPDRRGALELHVRDRKPLLESAIAAAARDSARSDESFAFILGWCRWYWRPAPANARKSIGITSSPA